MEDRKPEANAGAGRFAPATGDRPTAWALGPEGLGGWLILVGLGLALAPFRLGSELVKLYRPILAEDTWAALTTPGGAAYHPWWAPLLGGEIAVNTLFFLASVVLLHLFFTRKRIFPTFFMVVVMARPLFIIIDAHIGTLVFNEATAGLGLPAESAFDRDTALNFGQSLLYALVWVPYMTFSKRVRNTFTRPWRITVDRREIEARADRAGTDQSRRDAR